MSLEYAQAALNELARCVQERSAIDRASAEGAEQGAASLSGDALQGLAEVIQNADDQAASEVRISLRVDADDQQVLIIVHDGRPVGLDHVVAMAFPWITTKRGDAAATGRFGIGLRTLNSLGGPLQVHCSPYHVELRDQTVQALPGEPAIPGIYDPGARHTLLKLPLSAALDVGTVREWLDDVAASGLVFLRNVRSVRLVSDNGSGVDLTVSLVAPARRVRLSDFTAPVTHERLVGSDGVQWQKYTANVPVPAGLSRRGKAASPTSPVQIAFPDRPVACRVHAVLPVEPSGLPFAINAQFDPETGRRHLLRNDWNDWLFAQVGLLAQAVATHRLRKGSPDAWRAIPLRADLEGTASPDLATALLSFVVEPSAKALLSDATVPTSSGVAALDELDFEAPELEGLVGAREIEHLVGPDAKVLPVRHRDPAERWRLVLGEMSLRPTISIVKALELFASPSLPWRPRQFAALTRLALADPTARVSLPSRLCVVLTDGSRIAPPDPSTGTKLVEAVDEDSLAARLGLARQVHEEFLAAAPSVVEWLRGRSSLVQRHDSPSALVQSLSRITEAVALRPSDLRILRDAFDELTEDQRRQFGPEVGQRITLPCRRFVGGKWEATSASPSAAYLPGSIEKVRDSWARAAGRTPGLIWLAPAVGDSLKGAGREASGAIKFMKLLGAAVGPRLHEPPGTLQHYRRTPVLVTPIDSHRPKAQLAELAMPPHTSATHLRGDRASADLVAVAQSIASDKRSGRVVRARALLATLSRGWAEYQEHATAEAVLAYDGYYAPQGTVTATWLAELRGVAWVPTGRAAAAPGDTAVRTPATELIYGRGATSFVTPGVVDGVRQDVLRAVGIRLDPAASSLVQELVDLRDSELSAGEKGPTVSDDCRSLYRLLTEHLRRSGSAGRVDDMTLADLRRHFAGGVGLVRTDLGWRQPSQTLRGRPIFGRHRAWAPGGAETLPLWTALQIPAVAAQDCVAVIREIAEKRTLHSRDEGVLLEALECLADLAPSMTDDDRASLKRLPLWSGERWIRARPVAMLDDDALSRALPAQVTVWNPPLPMPRLLPLLAPMGVQPIDTAILAATEVSPTAQVLGEVARARFAKACQHLAAELPRSDVALAKSSRVDLAQLARAPVLLVPGLKVRVPHPAGDIDLPVRAHVRLDPLAWLVADEHAGGAPDGAAMAVARLFSGDRQKVAWAWMAMWHKAGDSEARPAEAPALSRVTNDADPLEALVSTASRRSRERAARAAPGLTADAPAEEIKATPSAAPRRLKDPSALVIEAASLVRPGAAPAGVTVPKRRGLRSLDGLPAVDGVRKTPSRQPGLDYTPDERQELALEVLRLLLDEGPDDLVDVAALRGIGADALSRDNRPFELKTAGREMPDHVTLTANEADRAARTPGFCLVVVAGLEEGQETTVVVVVDPLDALPLHFNGDVTVSDLRSRVRQVGAPAVASTAPA